MTDAKLVQQFQRCERMLNKAGYKVSVTDNGFYIHNNKGTIVGDVQTVDGLYGFFQGAEWVEASKVGALT